MKYKIVATDFDDTLLRSDLTISSYTRDVIARYEAAGGTFMISTGRMYSSIKKSILRAGLKGLVIAYQGGIIADTETDKFLYHKKIPLSLAIEQVGMLEEEGEVVQVYYNDKLYVQKMTEFTAQYERVCEVKAEITDRPLCGMIEEYGWEPTKILSIMPPERVKRRYLEFSKKYGEALDFSISKPYFFEILAKGVSKGNAINSLCKTMGLDSSNVIAFGDAINDISMLEFADLSFAVENAQTEAKLAAKQICPSNDEDGVAKMIEKYCLQGE